MKKVQLYWWNVITNWGDLLSPLLLNRFSNVNITWSPVESAEIVCVGSLLGNLIKSDYTGIILGTGKLFEDGVVPPFAKILALRGPLTAAGVKGSFALGDPGLLADELINVDEKLHNLGLVPHWSDHTLAKNPLFLQYKPLIINSYDDPLSVVRQIGSCKKIVSSSLHGLILADAFNIPRRFEATASWSREGRDFKVRDHNAAINLPFKIGVTQQANSNRVDECKSALWDAFHAYGRMVRTNSNE